MITLHKGDCKDILQASEFNEHFDLIYLDPPFNTKVDYNINPTKFAFKDIWTMDESYRQDLTLIRGFGNKQIIRWVQFQTDNLTPDMASYLTFMSARMILLYKVLKETGTIYLHCDLSASHYLKQMMDCVFGVQNFQCEIIWKSTASPKHQAKTFGNHKQTILFYTKSKKFIFNKLYKPHGVTSLRNYHHEDEKGKFMGAPIMAYGILAMNKRKRFEFMGVTAEFLHTKENLEKLRLEGRIYQTKKDIRRKIYLHETPGVRITELFDDILPVKKEAEKTGYPTQKPILLLERLIKSSSNEGDTVLDPFVGSGTTMEAAEKLNRHGHAIDISDEALRITQGRVEALDTNKSFCYC